MLNRNPFYNQLTRKYTLLFGNIFNNITLVRTTDTGELERFIVPIIYAPKEKYITRTAVDPNFNKETSLTLPRISYNLMGMNYAGQRKQNSLLRAAKGNTATGYVTQYQGVPYDLTFELAVYARNIDDGCQIIEQILPFFNPTHTPYIEVNSQSGVKKDIPVTLDSVEYEVVYEGDNESTRMVYWTFSFTMQVDYWGPIQTPKIIREVITNIYNDPSLQSGYIVRINTASGNNGDYKLGDIVYQGTSYESATAYGEVISWSRGTGKLQLGGTQGQFVVNSSIHAVSTNAAYNLYSFDSNPLKLVNIDIVPNPLNALPNSDYGYTVSISEWPYTT